MSDDWKASIDWKLERRRKMQEEENKKAALYQHEKAIREYQTKLKEHKAKFCCHILNCTNTSAGPDEMHSPAYISGDNWDPPVDYIHWDTPTKLFKCSICFKWTCSEHIHKGICMECARIF